MTEREILLERLLREQHLVFMDCFLKGVKPDDILRERAFVSLTQRLKAAGVLPETVTK